MLKTLVFPWISLKAMSTLKFQYDTRHGTALPVRACSRWWEILSPLHRRSGYLWSTALRSALTGRGWILSIPRPMPGPPGKTTTGASGSVPLPCPQYLSFMYVSEGWISVFLHDLRQGGRKHEPSHAQISFADHLGKLRYSNLRPARPSRSCWSITSASYFPIWVGNFVGGGKCVWLHRQTMMMNLCKQRTIPGNIT